MRNDPAPPQFSGSLVCSRPRFVRPMDSFVLHCGTAELAEKATRRKKQNQPLRFDFKI